MNSKKIFLGLFFTVLLISCNKDRDDDATITADDVVVNASIDAANDDVAGTAEDQFYETINNPLGKMSSNYNSIAACAVISRTPALGTPITMGTTITKTIDFGTSGCTLSNGNVLKGKIIILFVYQGSNPSTAQTITVNFDNFYHNSNKIEGTKVLTRTMSVATVNSLSYPIVQVNMNLTITRPNGNVITRTGTRTREFVEGFYSPLVWQDNVYKITGNWVTTHPNGNVQTANITSPVYVKLNCANTQTSPRPSVFASGIISFSRGTHTATLDFGNGECDNNAVFTLDGVARTITIN